MIIEDTEGPSEVKTPRFPDKKYIMVQNHVREVNIQLKSDDKQRGNSPEPRPLKSSKKAKKRRKEASVSADDSTPSNSEGISESDLHELRTVYKKCKQVIERIETKYGHLLELDFEASANRKRENNHADCKCSANKKIIFGENGEEILQETPCPSIHICPSKLKHKEITPYSDNRDLQVEFQEQTLPDDLQTLTDIVKDSSLNLTYRNKAVYKIRSIKMEHMNELRFNKPSIIEKLKNGSSDVFEFNGSNLMTLPGYPNNPM